MAGRAIRIFLVDGSPNGLRTAEVGLSTVKGVFAPRGALEALSKRSESRRTGVYVLIGEDSANPGRTAVYVGEGDDVLDRILQHDKDPSRDFWDRVALFVSKDLNLTKAHVRFLEAKLVESATQAKRATVLNKTVPIGGHLPEADAAEMDEFLEHIQILLATLSVTAFEVAPTAAKATRASIAQRGLELTMSGEGYRGTCILLNGEFVVQSGSTARATEAHSLSPSSRSLRKELLAAGVLRLTPKGLQFTQDYSFSSPSGAAQVVCGANVNGRITWRTSKGETFKDWQDRHLAPPDGEE